MIIPSWPQCTAQHHREMMGRWARYWRRMKDASPMAAEFGLKMAARRRDASLAVVGQRVPPVLPDVAGNVKL